MIVKKYASLLTGLLFIFLGMQQAVAQNSNVEAYIQQYKSLAMDEMVRTGVPAAISLAQGIVESAAGTSWLSVHANNQFGVKCKSDWTGKTVHHHDDRRNECFRKYKSVAASWRDHSDFLKNSSRYHFLFYLDPLDYKAWAYGLKQAGYATSNRYARKLIATIQKYNLNRFSKNGLALSKKKPENEFAKVLNKKVHGTETKAKSPSPIVAHHPEQKSKYPAHVFKINKRSVLFLPKGTQLIAIANQFDVPLRRIVRYNELQSDVLSQGMLIFVEKKRKKGDQATHVVQPGETWHEIAQEEGIRLKWLLKRNHATGSTPPQPGNTLVLKGYAPEPNGSSHEKKPGFFARLFGGHKSHEIKNNRPVPMEQPDSMPETIQNPSHTTPAGNATFVYEVKSGDTLYGIAKKFNVTVDSIRQLNHLRGDLIQAGQKLQIPGK